MSTEALQPSIDRPARPRAQLQLRQALGRPVVTLAFASLVLAGVTGFAAMSIGSAYLENHSYFFDPVSYSYYSAVLYTRSAIEGPWAVAASEWVENIRHPLRTVPVLLLAPQLLALPMGHMATTLPMLGIFLFVLGRVVYQRTGSSLYAVGCMALYCALPGNFNPQFGLSSYWLDVGAVLLAGAASLSLLHSDNGRKLAWLAGFAALAAFAAIGRYVAGGYILVMCGPILAVYLARRWRNEKDFVSTVVKPVALIGVIVAVLAGYYLAAHFRFNISYYSDYGFALGAELQRVAQIGLQAMSAYVGNLPALLLTGLWALNLWHFRDRSAGWGSLAATAWLALAHILFVTVVLRIDDRKTILYALPPLFLLAAAPTAWRKDRAFQTRGAILGLALVAVAVFLGLRYSDNASYWATRPAPAAVEQKTFDAVLAQRLADEGDGIVWQSYFAEYGVIPALEAFYAHGRLPLSAGAAFFTNHQTHWLAKYPGLSPEQVTRQVVDQTNAWVEVAVILDDPATSPAVFRNEYSRAVAAGVAAAIQDDPRWTPIFTLDSLLYGPLTGYRNSSVIHDNNYELLLRYRRLDAWLFAGAANLPGADE